MSLEDQLRTLEGQIETLERGTWQPTADGSSAVAAASYMFQSLGATGSNWSSWPTASWSVVKESLGSNPLDPIAPFQLGPTGRALALMRTQINPGVWGATYGDDYTAWVSIGYTATAPNGGVTVQTAKEYNSVSLGLTIDPAVAAAIGGVTVFATGARTIIIDEEPFSTISNLTVWSKTTGADAGDGAIRGSTVSVINL